MRHTLKYCTTLFIIMLSSVALTNNSYAAITSYDVTSQGKINCSGSPHGLWTNQLRLGSGNCRQYYDYQQGSKLVVDTTSETAVLTATAVNPDGIEARISFTWDNIVAFADWTGVVKNGGNGNPSDWLYFSSGSGAVDFFRNGSKIGTAALAIMPNTALQLGLGANDKTNTFGASSWLKQEYVGRGDANGRHWDFNMDLTASVPEPDSAALLLLGLAGLLVHRKRLKAKQV